ncbi:MAG: TlpA family protein disulfide reductase [Deltaproteobacteria bacterium]|nr:TlpA family protein disulfide reductase [Deltaproteobacteria bacterium]
MKLVPIALVGALLGGCTETPDAKAPANGDAVPAAADDAVGSKAPDFDLKTLDGESITLSSLRGKVVLVDFWSTICDPCLKEMPELVRLYQERKDKGFVVLAVATDGPETVANVSRVAKAENMVFPVLLDTETTVLDRYNPEGRLPFTEVIDRNGNVVLKRSGYQPGDVESQKRLVEAIDKAMAQ